MANKRHRPPWPNQGAQEKPGVPSPPIGPDETANWPGNPGPTQTRTRDRAGTPKSKIHEKSEGL
jgi:hypothetical protein